jgi:tetratricopeptide (TPR) repeat protein
MAGDPFGRARVARNLGLAGKAIDVLLKSHPDLYGEDGLRMLLDLLLSTGQADAAGAMLEREELVRNPDALGYYELPGAMREGRRWSYRLHAYDWFTFAQAAAAGRYDRAIPALGRLRERLRADARFLAPRVLSAFSRQLGSEVGLAAPPPTVLNRLHSGRERELMSEMVFQFRVLTVQEADLHAIAGTLHVEQGSPAAAADEFARALDLYASAKDALPNPGGQPLAARYLDAVRRQSKLTARR